MNENVASGLVILGLAGVNWTELVQRLSAGTLPALADLLRSAAAGPLIQPGPMAGAGRWATLATGVGPAKHGIILRDERWAGGVRPTGAASWRTEPLWARLARAGLHTGSIGWPAMTPGARWAGDHVDERFAQPHGTTWDDWMLPPDVLPESLREEMRSLRMHPHDVTGAMLAPLVPALASIDQSRDHRLAPIAVALARLSTDHAAAHHLLGTARHDVLFIQHDWLEALYPDYRNAAPPFAGVIEAAWTLLDQLIARIAQQAKDRTLLIAGLPHDGQPGSLIVAGPGIAPGKIAGATLADIAPTILARLGFVDPALPGRALLPSDAPLAPLPPAQPRQAPPEPDARALARLATFGLLPPVAGDADRARRLAVKAEMLLLSETDAALGLTEEALALAPDNVLALGVKAAAHVLTEDGAALAPIAAQLATVAPDHPWLSLIRGADAALNGDKSAARTHLLAVEQGGVPELMARAAMLWLRLDRPTDAERCARAILEKRPADIGAMILLARAIAMRPSEAEPVWRAVLALDPTNDATRTGLAALLRRIGRSQEAAELDVSVS